MKSDLMSTIWLLEKVRNSDAYAQNLYAALCNNSFQKRELWPILKDDRWSCSWRSAGGIVADMQDRGGYLDWYCSGMGGIADYNTDQDEWSKRTGYVPEGYVTEEVKTDIERLGWIIIEENDND